MLSQLVEGHSFDTRPVGKIKRTGDLNVPRFLVKI